MADIYKPFLIAVGRAGAYSDDMTYDPPFDTRESFGLWIKHIPYTTFPKIKDVVAQNWADEQGEDVWLPTTGIMNDAYDLSVEFVYYANDGMANERIRAFVERIRGKWLKIHDGYTNIGRQAVYLQEFDQEPTFLRRGLKDVVIFKVSFRVNDPSTNITL